MKTDNTWAQRDRRRKSAQKNVTTYIPRRLLAKFEAAKKRRGIREERDLTNSEYVRLLIEADL